MDEEQNNDEQMQNDVGQVEEGIKQFGKSASGKAGNAASNLIDRQRRKNKKLKLAQNNTTKDGFVSPGKKFKGKKYQLEGKKKIAEGTSKKATGDAMQAAGMGTRIAAKGVKAAGTAAQALDAVAPGVGTTIKAVATATAETMEASGKTMQDVGKEVSDIGTEEIKSGKEKVKRGQTLEQTGKDIGEKQGAIPNKAIPGMPKIPAMPNIKTIIATAKKKGVFKLIFIIGIIAVIVFLMAIAIIIGLEVEEGSYIEGDNSNVPYVVTSNIIDNIVIDINSSGKWDFMCTDKEGNYISIDEALDNVLKIIKVNNHGLYEDLGYTDSSRKKFLKLLVEAEIATQYPNIGEKVRKNILEEGASKKDVAKSKLEGKINIKRKDENGNIKELKYIDEASFNQMLGSESSDIMNYYTLKKGGSAFGTPSSLSGSESMEQTWNFLMDCGCTEHGVSGLMGNLMEESGVVSVRVQGDFSNGYQYSIDYTEKVDSGAISEYDFVYHGPNGGGYGLAQWTDPGRKQRLYTYAKSRGKSIGDLQMQLEFLANELNTYFPSIWQRMQNSSDKDEISDLVLKDFERPADIPGNISTRRKNALNVYSKYTGTRSSGSSRNNSDDERDSNSSNSSNRNSEDDSDSDSRESSDNNVSNNESSESQTDSSKSDSIASFDKFLFVGDSRYAGIQSQLQGFGTGVNVQAVSGSTAQQWLDTTSSGAGVVNGTSITLPESEEVSNISVMLGVNNTSQITELEQVLQNLHNRYPDAKIFYNSAYHVASNYTVIDPATMNANIDTLNQTIKEYCNGCGWLTYVDVTENLNDENGFLKSADSEGIHLTGEGCTTLVNNIKSKIQGNRSGSNNSSGGSSSTSSYVLVVANSNTQETYTVDSYDELLYSQIVSTSSGTTQIVNSGTRHTNPPAPKAESSSITTYSSTCIDYQRAVKDHTLYFDFLWAVFVETRDKDLVEDWAQIAMDSEIDITVYSESQSTKSTTEYDLNPITVYGNLEGTTSYQDVYKGKRTTTVTTTTVASKLAITNADTWLMEYKNDAPTYEEYQAKTSELVREKTDEDDEIMKLLRANDDRLEGMNTGAYKVERMLQNNEKVSFMYNIYQYFIDKAMGKKTEYKSLQELIDVGSFDVNTFSGSFGNASGDGSMGGVEIAESGIGYNDIFKVGTRTYKNYKQLNYNCPWLGESLAGFPGSRLGQSGCAINAIAVILSGYGIDKTPKEVNDYAKSTSTPTCHDRTLGALLGKHVTHHMSGNFSEIIIQQLNSGKPCMVRSRAYSSSHYFCILAISEDGTQIYVSDVGGDYPGQGRDGWQPISFLSRICEVFAIDD